MNSFRFCFYCVCGFATVSMSTAHAQLFKRQHRLAECGPVNLCQSVPLCAPVQSPVPCVANEMVFSCAEPTTCTLDVPNTVTKSYSASDPSSQIKEDIKRVKEKLDSIQPGQDPSLLKLQDELREIKELIKKNANSTTEVLGRIEESERLVENMIHGTERKWHDATRTRHVQARLIAHDSRHVLLKREDGKEFRIELGQLSDEDQKFVRSIQ